MGGDETSAHCCRLAECHQTAQEVQPGDLCFDRMLDRLIDLMGLIGRLLYLTSKGRI